MLEPKEWSGNWSIDLGYGETQYHGSLTYNPSKEILLKVSKDNIHGSELLFLLSHEKSIKLITGIDNRTGQVLLLLDCFVKNLKSQKGLYLELSIGIIIEGEPEVNIITQFNQAIVDYSGLGAWLDKSGIKIEHDDKFRPFRGYTAKYTQPDPISIKGKSFPTIDFIFWSQVKQDKSTMDQWVLEESYQVEFTFTSPVPFQGKNGVSDTIEHFRRFLSVLYDQNCSIRTFKISNKEETEQYPRYWNVYLSNGSPFEEKPNRYAILFRYPQIMDKFEYMLQRWFEYHASDDLDYVAYIAAKQLAVFSEEVFLEKARALEVLCRVLKPNTACSEEERRRFSDNVLTKISISDFLSSDSNPDQATPEQKKAFKNIRDKLKMSLKYINQGDLRLMIKRLLKEAQSQINETSFKSLFPNSDTLADMIVDSRNYFTHYDENTRTKLGDKLPSIFELYELQNACKIILIIFLFEDLGIPLNESALALERWHKKT